MGSFLLSEKYKLEIHWEKTNYENDGICNLENAYFSGPVLSIAEKIKPNDNINLDFYKQYIVLTKNVYVANLSWGDVINGDNKVVLKTAKITHDTELNRVPKLKNTDYLVVDTSGHENEGHAYNFVYPTYVINIDSNLYDFNKK
jgi:hypothetical protein